MELIERILAKTAVSNARAMLQHMIEMIQNKNPEHEIIPRTNVLIDDLQNTRLYLIDTEDEIRILRNLLLTADIIRLEQAREIEKLNAKVQELLEFL